MQDPIYNSLLIKNFIRLIQQSGNLEKLENKVYFLFKRLDVCLFFELVDSFRQPLRYINFTKKYRKRQIKVTKVPTIANLKSQYYFSLKLFLSFLGKEPNLLDRLLNFFNKLPSFLLIPQIQNIRTSFKNNRFYIHFR
jgi:hypothetical protein